MPERDDDLLPADLISSAEAIFSYVETTHLMNF